MLNNVELAARFIFMAERFKNLHVMYEPEVNFGVGSVPCTENLCGTPACHGGWALVALQPVASERAEQRWWRYSDGADFLAEYLGFEGRYFLQEWAERNPQIWGSECGAFMFRSEGYKAFGRDTNDLTLLDIAAWYLGVADRLLSAYQKQQEFFRLKGVIADTLALAEI